MKVDLSSDLGLDVNQQALGDLEICVAVIDSRVDLSHPCFAGAQLQEIMPAWLKSVMAPTGASHGTHVASVIFGQPGSPVAGLAPRCRGILIPVYGETEDGELRPCSQEDLARAISLALQAGAHLINISGGELIRPGDVDRFLEQSVRTCDRQDVVVVAATGNEGCECLHVPASLPTVLAVGAADANGQPMAFSNWDESLASHGVLAPGEGIVGAVPGNGIAPKSGTSCACPIVTGAAAALLGLQRARGLRPSPKAVRDAIIRSAVPCAGEEQSQCQRMLGGRINISGARELLFARNALNPSAASLREGIPMDSIRSPPEDHGRAASPWPDGASHSTANPGKEGAVMTNEQTQGHTPGVTGAEVTAALQGFEPSRGGPQTQMAQPAADVPAMAGQIAVVRPQGVAASCGCGGAQPQQLMTPAQQEGVMAQQMAPVSYQGGVPAQSHLGAPPTVTPAQRTAMMAGLGGPGVGQQPAAMVGRGVTPSQANGHIPMPTDFINSSNSQLVYISGELGYDFITDARRDYFVQQFREMSENWRKNPELIKAGGVWPFDEELGLEPGPLYLPEDNRAMSAYLFQGRGGSSPVPPGDGPQGIGSVVWTLIQEGQALYALRPLHTFATYVLQEFANFLYDQSRVKYLDKDGKIPNPDRSERVSIAGRILGDITLYNGQQVPVLDVSLRALFNWNLKYLIQSVLGPRPDDQALAQAFDNKFDRLENFLQRIYYEVRNLGQAPSERAINYLTTNLFQANEAFQKALMENLELDSIFAEKSPLCRPKSDCWDVVMRFFDPRDRLGRALVEHRLTVDVSDLSPIGIGEVRTWSRFA